MRFCLVYLGKLMVVCFLLVTIRQIDGFKFSVYPTDFCPRNQMEWNKRSLAINCSEDNGYLCLPNNDLTVLLELCFERHHILIEKGICLYWDKQDSNIYSYDCSTFRSGCPDFSFSSRELFKLQAIVGEGNHFRGKLVDSSMECFYLRCLVQWGKLWYVPFHLF